MSQRICPWWCGYLLASPLRRLRQNPRAILRPFVLEGMTVLEPGPGMGFFTLELARMVGARGRLIAVDVQPKMIKELIRRAERAGLKDRIDVRLAKGDLLGTEDLEGKVDFVLAFAVVHELPNAAAFFEEMFRCLRSRGRLFVSEPARRVHEKDFDRTVETAVQIGFAVEQRPAVQGNRSVVFVRAELSEARALRG
jgi:SAM-dependent methyltransferase